MKFIKEAGFKNLASLLKAVFNNRLQKIFQKKSCFSRGRLTKKTATLHTTNE